MKLIDLDAEQDYLLDGKYKVKIGSDYLPVSKQIKKLLQEIAQKKRDNDYIKREDAINTVSSLVRDEERFVQEYAIDRIKRIPSAGVNLVEVVRCKGCIHNDQCKHRVVMWVEDPINTWHKDIDFCSYGERKDDE